MYIKCIIHDHLDIYNIVTNIIYVCILHVFIYV